MIRLISSLIVDRDGRWRMDSRINDGADGEQINDQDHVDIDSFLEEITAQDIAVRRLCLFHCL